ncbi:putative ATP-dependent RNA helicase TDRD12 [Schistocerca piceifrons]|uniref:putative ATP-dependent RNA helicase TDRD12 n=1 Tax=Schistocerca piceifrons TaxID=274613 RepID=UPI001F5FA7F7|nr:putative ATP-dependent RNA helicase TDRD12 [Schistocerca piceifrons]
MEKHNIIAELPSDAKKVVLGDMISSSAFWVMDPNDINMSEQRKEFLVKEEILSIRCSQAKASDHFLPKEAEMVAVQHPLTCRWHRGTVLRLSKLDRGYIYRVFLVDYGISIDVRNGAIKELPREMMRLKPQAYQIELYGVVPTTVDLDYNVMKMKRIISEMWCPASAIFVRHVLRQSSGSYIVQKQQSKSRKRLYVDLYLSVDEGFINLGEELCDKEYAVFETQIFEDLLQCGLNDSSSGSESDFYSESLPCDASEVEVHTSSSSQSVTAECMEVHKRKRQFSSVGNEAFCSVSSNKELEEAACKRKQQVYSNLLDFLKEYSLNKSREKKELIVCKNRKHKASDEQLGALDTSSLGKHDIEVENVGNSVKVNSPLQQIPKTVNPPEFSTFIPVGAETKVSETPCLVRSVKNLSLSSSEKLSAGVTSVDQLQLVKPVSANGRTKMENNSLLDFFEKNYQKKNSLSQKAVDATETKETDATQLPQNMKDFSDDEKINETISSVATSQTDSVNCNDEVSCSQKKADQVAAHVLITEVENRGTTDCSSDKMNGENISLLDFLLKNKSSKRGQPNNSQQSACVVHTTQRDHQRESQALNELQNTSQLPATNNRSKLPKGNVEIFEPEEVILPETYSSGHAFKVDDSASVSERLVMSTVLVHGQNKTFKPIGTITEANFPKEVHETLYRLGIIEPMRIQTYMWPAILRGYSVVMVNPAKSGKTLSYIVPLISFLFRKNLYDDLPLGNGPVSLILCSSSASAQWIGNACTLLLSKKSPYKVVVTYGGGADSTKVNDLVNGCHILVSTPKCLWRLLQKGPLVVNFSRLCHLVLDEVDVLSFRFLSEVKLILAECKQALKKRAAGLSVSLQVIASSEKWCSPLESFAHNIISNPVICIGSYLEAAVYAKLKPNLYFVKRADRKSKLLDLLNSNFGLYKMVVVSESVEDVAELGLALKSAYEHVLIAHENMLHFDIEDVYRKWNLMKISGSYPILVCSDAILYDLKITDSLWLIHYGLPSESKSAFGFRFSCLMSNYRDMFSENDALHQECVVHILMGEENAKQLPTIVHLMKRLGATVSPDLEAVSTSILKKKDEEKVDMPLCYNIKAFGACWDRSQCLYRHVIIPEEDVVGNLPVNGKVKFKVLHVHDVTHFSVRLLEHFDLSGKKNILHSEYVKIEMCLSAFFLNENNRLSHGIPQVNDICAIEADKNLYKRVQVLSILKYDAHKNPTDVKVKFLDNGQYEACKVFRLLHIPEEFRHIPPQAVDVFLCHLVPCDLDWNWSHAASMKVYEWLNGVDDSEEQGKFMIGKILLSLSATLWLDPIECHQLLPALKTTAVVLSLRQKILENDLGVENPHHMSRLYTLCEEAGLVLPEYCSEAQQCQNEKEGSLEPQWAFLSERDNTEIAFFTADSPSKFFIRNAKWEESYQKLEKELQNATEIKAGTPNLSIGDYCIGRYPPEDMWYRAKVLKIVEGKYELFFVDCGDRATVNQEDVAPISKTWIDRLPFQAVECELAGVLQISESNWGTATTDTFYDMMYLDDSGLLRYVHAKVCEKKENGATVTGGHKYRVILIDDEDTEEPIINKKLVQRGLAQLSESEKHLFDSCVLTKQQSSSVESRKKAKNKGLNKDHGTDINSQYDAAAASDDDDDDDNDNLDKLINKPGDVLVGLQNNQLVPYGAKIQDDMKTPLFDFNEFEMDDEDFYAFMDCLLKENKLSDDSESLECDSKDSVLIEEVKDNSCINGSSDIHVSSEIISERSPHSVQDTMPTLRTEAKIPQVHWRQNASHVWIKIALVGVEKYYLSCTGTTVEFSTNNDGLYHLILETYGQFHPDNINHSAKGLYVQIRLQKVLTGFKWPRLLKSEKKKSWLKIDHDYEETETEACFTMIEQDTQIHRTEGDSSCCKVLQTHEPVCSTEDHAPVPLYDSQDSDETDFSDDSSEKENPEMHFNPYDPWGYDI